MVQYFISSMAIWVRIVTGSGHTDHGGSADTGCIHRPKEYVKGLGGLTTGPHLHREIISGRARLNADPNEKFGIYSSDITYKADPDTFDINKPVFPYQNGEPKPALQSGQTSQPRSPQVRPSLPGSALSPDNPKPVVAPRPLPDTGIPGAGGPTSVGGPNGPAPLVPPVRSRSPAPPSPAPVADPTLPPLHFAPEEPRNFSPFALPKLFRSDALGGSDVASAVFGSNAPALITSSFGAPRVAPEATSPAVSGIDPIGDGNGIGDWKTSVALAPSSNPAQAPVRMLVRLPSSPSIDPGQSGEAAAAPAITDRAPSFPPVRFPLEALLAPDRNRALDQWASSSRRKDAPPPTQRASIGLPGLFASLQGGDPSNRDQPPVGGLLGMIEDYMRTNGY
ncbi:hypothetical protein JQ604_30695 [Bradyrhizobium jicamae]|uniref:hypothetical protein n=1 Tax=Bradyrhizobium jicamae TaxID=280332 RepID=UPI001BA765DA|nr:hypothetical protein [Bradyrhizobium jicamae]MBR0756569.1 hypothetical protein [Bradyrhizobium jicamae]